MSKRETGFSQTVMSHHSCLLGGLLQVPEDATAGNAAADDRSAKKSPEKMLKERISKET
jgi:hypothetical protein